LNRAALISFLTFGSVYEPETMVEHVRTLRPGHYLKWKNGDLQETQYWDLTPRLKSSGPCDRAESEQTQAEVQAALEQSVCMQTVSDVPVGVFLSGGIDSSVLAGILSKGKSKVSTFSLVFRETDYSEAEYSRMIARQFNTDHHELVVSQQDALSAIPGAVHAMDQPTIDGFNTFLVSQYTRRAGIKVALSGLGGDELFGGYASFRTVPRMERFARLWGHLPATVRRAAAEALTLTARDTDHNHKLACLVRGNGNLLHPYFLSRMLFTPDQWNRLVSTVDLEAPRRAEAPLAETLNRAADFDPINRVSYLEARCYMLNTLLRDSDVMSMAHGLEVRVPLVDHCLAEKLFALPGECKLSETSPKPLLLRALGRSLPPQIVQRRKHGFVLPFDHWLQGEIRGEVDQAFRGIESNPLAAVLSPAAIRQVWANFLAGRTSWSRPWSLYVLCRWCELHSVGV
jgi:asparagine synthase (glutamine-hydrolysing)